MTQARTNPQPLSAVIERQVAQLREQFTLPTPMPPPMASALRSMVTAAECAALAGVEPEHFDGLLAMARRAYAEKRAPGSVGFWTR